MSKRCFKGQRIRWLVSAFQAQTTRQKRGPPREDKAREGSLATPGNLDGGRAWLKELAPGIQEKGVPPLFFRPSGENCMQNAGGRVPRISICSLPLACHQPREHEDARNIGARCWLVHEFAPPPPVLSESLRPFLDAAGRYNAPPLIWLASSVWLGRSSRVDMSCQEECFLLSSWGGKIGVIRNGPGVGITPWRTRASREAQLQPSSHFAPSQGLLS